MKPGERHPCGCQCDCTCSADASAPLCWMCTEGTHALTRDQRARLERGLDRQARLLAEMTPDSSSGISKKALAVVAERYEAGR